MAQLTDEVIAVIGLGYVGLPVALRFAERYRTIGFDIAEARIEQLRAGHDETHEVEDDALRASTIELTCDPAQLADASFFIVAVPTPIDTDRRPDLRPLVSASKTVGPHLRAGDIVVADRIVTTESGDGLEPDPDLV